MHLSLLRSAASSSLLFDKRVDTSRYSGMRDAFACADRGNGPNGDLVVLSLACLFKGDDSDVKVNGANDAVKVADEKTSTAEKIINDFQGRIVSVRRSLIERGAIPTSDRCSSTKCRDGESCVLNKDGDAECACIAQCEDPKDERLMVHWNESIRLCFTDGFFVCRFARKRITRTRPIVNSIKCNAGAARVTIVARALLL